MDLSGAQLQTRRESRTHRSQRQGPAQDTREAAMAAAAAASPGKKSALGRGPRSHAHGPPLDPAGCDVSEALVLWDGGVGCKPS